MKKYYLELPSMNLLKSVYIPEFNPEINTVDTELYTDSYEEAFEVYKERIFEIQNHLYEFLERACEKYDEHLDTKIKEKK